MGKIKKFNIDKHTTEDVILAGKIILSIIEDNIPNDKEHSINGNYKGFIFKKTRYHRKDIEGNVKVINILNSKAFVLSSIRNVLRILFPEKIEGVTETSQGRRE